MLLDLFLRLGCRIDAEDNEDDVKSELGKEPDQATEDGDQRALPGLCLLGDGQEPDAVELAARGRDWSCRVSKEEVVNDVELVEDCDQNQWEGLCYHEWCQRKEQCLGSAHRWRMLV